MFILKELNQVWNLNAREGSSSPGFSVGVSVGEPEDELSSEGVRGGDGESEDSGVSSLLVIVPVLP